MVNLNRNEMIKMVELIIELKREKGSRMFILPPEMMTDLQLQNFIINQTDLSGEGINKIKFFDLLILLNSNVNQKHKAPVVAMKSPKRKLTSYNKFVKKNMHNKKLDGLEPRDKMRKIANMWKNRTSK